MSDSWNVILSKWIDVPTQSSSSQHGEPHQQLVHPRSHWKKSQLMFCDCRTTNVPPLPHLYTGGLQVSYMDIYKLTSSTNDWNTWQYNHPNQLNPSLYEWTTSRYTYNIFMYTIKPIHVQLHCIYAKKKCGLKNKKKYFLCFITLQSLQWAQMSLSSPQHTLSGHVPAQKGLKRG